MHSRLPSNSNEQHTSLLIEHCYETYKTKIQSEFSSIAESDEFYQLHTEALFLSLSTFSENLSSISVQANFIDRLTEKLKNAYEDWKQKFNEKQANLEAECAQTLNESLKKYNLEMTKRCNGVSKDELKRAHQHASRVATTNLDRINTSNSRRVNLALKHLEKCVELQGEYYKVKHGIEVTLDDGWFVKLEEAVDLYEKKMSEKCRSGITVDQLKTVDVKAAKEATKCLDFIKTKSKPRYNYAKSLLEKSMDSLKAFFMKQCGYNIGSAIDSGKVFIRTGDDGFIGRGGFGHVQLGLIKSVGSVAIKQQCMHGSRQEIDKNTKKFIKEVRLLNEANHSHIVRIEGYTSWCSSMAIVMEYLPGGNLHDLLVTKNYDISPSIKLRFSADISSGITYLHNGFNDERMVHGDLKPANILLTSDLRCKVADFGGAEFATQTVDAGSYPPQMKGGERTQGFTAPERLSQHFERLNRSMDVYSYGAILYVILQRHNPNPNPTTFRNHLTACCNNDGDPTISLLSKWMRKCTAECSNDRPSMIDVRNELQEKCCSQDVSSLAKEVANILKKMQIKIPYLKVEECKPLSELSNNFMA